ncbi:acyl carrier protein 4, chloroplastic-like [Tasmannia lanceolata]|uniref:acyl carrier protein 4, chloroplastic-like n=1 Tax=Tasmannia lanceolata TaxID=3420 RepID=UPI004062E3B8
MYQPQCKSLVNRFSLRGFLYTRALHLLYCEKKMAALISISPSPISTLSTTMPAAGTRCPRNSFPTIRVALVGGLKLAHKIQFTKATKRSPSHPNCFKTTISSSIAQPETLQTVQSTIAKQLSVSEDTVTPQTKFADLGADSLDTVEIMMALEEKFGVSIGEGGAENISTVQDAADLIEKVKAGDV